MANGLRDAAGSYLRRHAEDPVDWRPWGDEAFREAARRGVPVLLSIGFDSCHWCHVMARESFRDEDTATYLNEHFVAVKVDREEHPDVDAAYLAAAQTLSGRAGWPLTCFLTAERAPFYAATYLPPQPSRGTPSFRQVLEAVAAGWHEQPERLRDGAARLVVTMRRNAGGLDDGARAAIDEAGLELAARRVRSEFDPEHGGLRGAPKFPNPLLLEFLLRQHERTGDAASLAAVTLTADRMRAGGLHDLLSGGFSRYSTDAVWRMPHFEMMLEDNALLLGLYAHHARRTGSAGSRRTAEAIAGFLLDGLRTPDGAFATALDADSDGVEGGAYLWTRAQLVGALGPRDGAEAAERLDVGDAPATLRLGDEADLGWFETVRPRLRAAQLARTAPLRDEIVTLASNGLAIAALADAAALWRRPELLAAGIAAAEYLIDVHRRDDGWRHSSFQGVSGAMPAVQADVGAFATGLLALHRVTGADRWLALAGELLDAPAPDRAELPFAAPRGADIAGPSGASALAGALLEAAALTERADLRARAEELLAPLPLVDDPAAHGYALAVAEAAVAGPLQIAIVAGEPESGADDALYRAALRHAPAGAIVLVGDEGDARPLLAGRTALDGRSTAYVCRGFVCRLPVTDEEALRRELGAALGRSSYEAAPRN